MIPVLLYAEKSQTTYFIGVQRNCTSRLTIHRATQEAITCSKITIETLEQGVPGVVLVSLVLTLKIFHTLF